MIFCSSTAVLSGTYSRGKQGQRRYVFVPNDVTVIPTHIEFPRSIYEAKSVPSRREWALRGNGFCLVNRSWELHVRWNYCYVTWNRHVLLWPRLLLQYVPGTSAVKQQNVLQFLLELDLVCLFAVKLRCTS